VSLVFGLFSCVSSKAGGGTGADIYGGLGKAQDPVPLPSALRTGTLPNGLRYYILQNARPENRAFLTLAVNTGSVLETDDEQGLAHFVEHMAFNGTGRFPESELLDYLRSLGMSFGADVNAYTSFDETVYGIEVPTEFGADGLKHIPGRALAIMDDWSRAISFVPKDVDEERLVIMEEWRSRLGASERINRKMLPVLLQGSPYPDRWPIGLPEIIQNAPASRLEGFYKKWYRPDNMALILVGDFDAGAMETALASLFGAPKPATPLDRPAYELPAPQKGRLAVEIITDPEFPYTELIVYYKGPPQARTGDLAAYRGDLTGSMIDWMIAQRFAEASLKPETPYAGAGTWGERYGQASNFYALAVIAKPGQERESFRALMLEKESISRYGFTNAEIGRAKRALISSLNQQVSEKDRLESSSYIDSLTGNFLRGEVVPDPDWELAAANALLPGISAADISAAINQYFVADDITVFVIGPEANPASLPTQADISSIISESRTARIEPPQETETGSELLDRDPVPGIIAAEDQDPDTGALLWTLGNGATVVLQPTANKNNEVAFSAMARGGLSGAAPGEEISARLAGEMLSFSGLGPYSRSELMQKLSDKQVSLSFEANLFHRGFEGMATTEDLKTLFELLYLNFTQPRIDSDAVSAFLDQYRTVLPLQLESPVSFFSYTLNRVLLGDHPAVRPLELADLDQVNIDAAMNFVRRGLNPADYCFVFTGNLDLAALRVYVETYLASIPAGTSWNSYPEAAIVARPGRLDQSIYKGKEAQSIVFLGWFKPEPYSELGEAVAAVLQGYLDIRLIQEIREKLGGVYSINADIAQSSLPNPGELLMESVFICDPGRAVELSDAVVGELNAIAQGNIDLDSFTKAVEALRKNWEESMQNNYYIAANYTDLAVRYQLPLGRLQSRPALYASVSPADIQEICRKLLPLGPVRLILYPEGWTK
jgi:zinc protease